MHWQDVAFMVGTLVMNVLLFVMAKMPNHFKPPVMVSAYMVMVSIIFEFCYMSLGYWMSTGANAVVIFLWLIVAVQKWRQNIIDGYMGRK